MAKWTKESLYEIDPKEFETLLSRLFSEMGYIADQTQYSRDKGIDIVLRIENLGLSHTWLVQAKRYSDPVGVKDVREYSSLRYRDRVDGVIIVTTSVFTKEAFKEATEHNLKLIDGSLLVEMLNHYIPNGCTGGFASHGIVDAGIRDDIECGAILKNGEKVIADEAVTISNEKFRIILTNKTIFLKKETKTFFSKQSDIEDRIELSELLGLHTEARGIILIVGGRDLKAYPISSRKAAKLAELFKALRPEYVKGEYLMISARKGNNLTLLTNKRLIIAHISDGIQKQIIHKDIVGVELKSSFLRKTGIIIIQDCGYMVKHFLDVDDPMTWKEMIGQCVRMS